MTFDAIVVAGTLKDFLAPVSALVDECKLRLDGDGIRVTAVDPANVAMVETSLSVSGFESYDADGGVIGLNLSTFEDVLALADSGQLVHLELNADTSTLDIRFGGVDYTLALIDPEAIRQEPDLPSIDAPAEIVATGEQLDQAVTAADLASDNIALNASAQEDVFWTDAEGDTDDVQVTFDRDGLVDADITETVRSLYSLDYLTSMVGVMDDEHEVMARLADEMPVRLAFDHSEGRASVEYLLSPRVAGGDA